MITFLLGLSGSGKTNFAVNKIFNNFSNDKTAKKDKNVTFKNCYNNINEFKYDKLKNVYALDFEKLYSILERLHSHTKGKNKKNDKYLLKFCRRLKIKDTLFVIDEAHNFFDKKDSVLVWWLSYHRHLHHEIILITQNLSLIESKYKAFSEFFYVAKPASLKLFSKHFKYNIYTHSRLSKPSHAGSIKINKNQKVFDLYKSGDSISTQNVILKFLSLALVIFLVLFFFMYFFVLDKDFYSDDTLNNNESIVTNTISHNPVPAVDSTTQIVNKDFDISNSVLLTFICSNNICNFKDITIPFELLKVFLVDEKIEFLYESKINFNSAIYYLNTSKEFYEYLSPIKERKDEKNKNNFGSVVPSSIFSSSSR